MFERDWSHFRGPHGHGMQHGRGRGGRGPGKGRRGHEDGRSADQGRPFGRGPLGHGRGGGGGRIFAPGDLRLVLLALIEDKPRHGYELIKELEQKFDGEYAPSPGSVYPTLTLLEELGQVRSTTPEGNRRLFEITTEGTRFLSENAAALKSAQARMEMAARAVSGDTPPHDLRHAMHTLRAALLFHRGGWNRKETERVRKIIEEAAEAIARTSDDE